MNENWTRAELSFLRKLKTPGGVQEYLNSLRYNDQPTAMSPRHVMRKRTAHCFEGALFAAAALRLHGHRPLLVDLSAENDDDHVIAVFRQGQFWGAVAKSNTTMLRLREPVYRSLRELVMSYFEGYFNTKGFKSLRGYTRPVNLVRFDPRQWMTSDEDLQYIGAHLTSLAHIQIVSRAQRALLSPADPDLVKACFLGSLESGLFKPE